MENRSPSRPVIRATVVWKPPPWSSQIATPAPDLESLRTPDGNLLLAEVAVDRQRGDGRPGLAQDRLPLLPADRHIRAEVQRVAHEVLALADLDRAPAEVSDVIHGRLQDPVIGPDQVGVAAADADRGPLAHRRVHRVRKLPLADLRGVVVGPGEAITRDDPAAEAEEEDDPADRRRRGDGRAMGHRKTPEIEVSI